LNINRDKKSAQEAIAMLSRLEVDSLGLRVWLEKKTKYGKKKHKSNPLGFVLEYLAYYNPDTDTELVISVLKAQGIETDSDCGRWLLIHDKLID
jgi:hypothetical protein